MGKKNSLAYKALVNVGLNFSEEEYGDITFTRAITRALKGVCKAILLKYCMYSVIFSPLNYRYIRPRLWRIMGAKVDKRAFIGYEVWMDFNHAELIEIGEGAHITNRCLLLCHQRDLKNYFVGDDSTKLPYTKKKIKIGKGVMVGMDTVIMPGVTIGEGAIIGAGSLITKDIPSWTIASGRPAKVIKEIPKRN
ncbi:acyltransferase [Salinimicrobium sp. HB62]|uniref:acyltransferase n=1 Tax=Salinimicrobium sp. HB62 TaxID=3077781 RepID=UPI002D76BCCA|nr:acyltransferase [Salinimicrobium sp. HB62]